MDNCHFGYKQKKFPPKKKTLVVVTWPEETPAEISRGR
jgi:hypothetical protein